MLLLLLLSRYISINIIVILSFIIRTIRFLLKIFWWNTCRPSWARAGSECRYVDPVLAWHSSPGGHVVFTLHSRPNMYILISISNIASKWTFCEAQGKGRARGGHRKVTQRSFMDGGWWMVDILSLMLYIKVGCHPPPPPTTRTFNFT